MILPLKRSVIFITKIVLLVLLIFLHYRIHWFETTFSLPAKFIEAFLFYLIANLVISFSRLLVEFFYLTRKNLSRGTRDNFIIGIEQIALILSFMAFVFATFTVFNLDLRSVFTSLSIVAAAIALLSKDYISNMINGMIIMFSDQLSINDYIKIGHHKGRISNITLINLHLINEDGDLIYIPNNSVFANDVINYSKGSEEKISVEFDFPFNQGKNLHQLERYLVHSLSDWKDQIMELSYKLKVLDIQKDFVILNFQFRTKKIDHEFEKNIRRYLRMKVIEFYTNTGPDR